MPDLSKRRPGRVRRRLKVAVGVRGRAIEATTGNLSATGMLLHASEMLLPGTAVSGLVVVEERQLHFSALVRWSRSASRLTPGSLHSMGIEFLDNPGRIYLGFVREASAAPDLDAAPAEPPVAVISKVSTHPSLNAFLSAAPPVRAPPPTASPAPPAARPPHTSLRPDLAPQKTPVASEVARHEAASTQLAAARSRPAPRFDSFGLVAGMSGRAEGSTRASGSRTAGSLPVAPSSVAVLFERASVQAVAPSLAAGVQTVGVSIQISLATPPQVTIGAKLEATAILIEITTERTLRFRVELREGDRLVASGEHCRLVL